MKPTLSFLFAVLTAAAQSTTEHLPSTDAEKIADVLRAVPNFITDGAPLSAHRPNAQQLIIYPDSGHRSLFQHAGAYTSNVSQFLDRKRLGGNYAVGS